MMRAAKLENSARLRSVLQVLERSTAPKSTMQLIQKSGHCAINSIISELRDNGIDVKFKRTGDAWYYWIGE